MRSAAMDCGGHTYCLTCIHHWVIEKRSLNCPMTGAPYVKRMVLPNYFARVHIAEWWENICAMLPESPEGWATRSRKKRVLVNACETPTRGPGFAQRAEVLDNIREDGDLVDLAQRLDEEVAVIERYVTGSVLAEESVDELGSPVLLPQ